MKFGAAAVDLGASSIRSAFGWMQDGRLHWKLDRQVHHAPSDVGGHHYWDINLFESFCREAKAKGESQFESSSFGVDSWAVDHCFVKNDQLLQPPVCYRDPSHVRKFEELKGSHNFLYQQTGIQLQPFNTVFQLAARYEENPQLAKADWLLLPDYLSWKLSGGQMSCEFTNAGSSQLLGLDDQWNSNCFELTGFPTSNLPIHHPGHHWGSNVVSVASHDSASAVAGLNPGAGEAFVILGTWALIGQIIDRPRMDGQAGNWTNERAHDGRIRFLRNVNGFYVVNRLHEELKIDVPVHVWLSEASDFESEFDLYDPIFFNPDSMVEACCSRMNRAPLSAGDWAAAALGSLATSVCKSLEALEVTRFVAGGGGARCRPLIKRIEQKSGLSSRLGPSEASIVGNLAVQLQHLTGQPLDDILAHESVEVSS